MGVVPFAKGASIVPTSIDGCVCVNLHPVDDKRGSFVKNYQEKEFREAGLETWFPEEFYSRSVEGVLRGIHFTVPPIDQVKVVTCVWGRVLDAVIDLRKDSPTFGKHLLFELSADKPMSLYIGRGLGHAFFVPSGEALLIYRVSTSYRAKYDAGIRWDSAGINWPTKNPIVSDRDRGLPPLSEFSSPFTLRGDD